ADTGSKLGGVPEGVQLSQGLFTPDGKLLFTATSPEIEIRGWDPKSGKAVTPPLRASYGMKDFQVGPMLDRGYTIAVQNGDGSVQLWNSASGEAVGKPLKTSGKVIWYGFSPDAKWIFGVFDDRKLQVWTAKDGKPASEPLVYDFDVASARFSPDSR